MNATENQVVSYHDFIKRNKFEAEKNGISCSCGCKKMNWKPTKLLWQCTQCGLKTTLKSRTFMRDSKLSLMVWYEAICIFFDTESSISNKELGRRLGIERYATVLYLSHKIRKQLAKYLSMKEYVSKAKYKTCFKGGGAKKSTFAKKKIQYFFDPSDSTFSRFITQKFRYKVQNAKSCRIPKIQEKYIVVKGKARQKFEKLRALLQNMEIEIMSLIKEVHRDVSKQHLQYYLDEFTYKKGITVKRERTSYFLKNLILN